MTRCTKVEEKLDLVLPSEVIAEMSSINKMYTRMSSQMSDWQPGWISFPL